MKKLKKIWLKYGLYICLMCCLVGIVGYFVNIMFFQNKKDALNILVLNSQIESNALLAEIEEAVDVGTEEEIVIKYMDTSGNEANRAIVLTWIRAKTVDIIIGEQEQLDFFAKNGCLLEIEKEIIGLDERYYNNCIINYDSEGNIIGKEEEKHYGVYVDEVAGVDFQKNPIVSFAVNLKNRDYAMKVLDFYINQK